VRTTRSRSPPNSAGYFRISQSPTSSASSVSFIVTNRIGFRPSGASWSRYSFQRPTPAARYAWYRVLAWSDGFSWMPVATPFAGRFTIPSGTACSSG
jgi:hypothetical protein